MPTLPSRSARPTRSWRRRRTAGLAGLGVGLGVLLAPAVPAFGADEYSNSVAAFDSSDNVYISPDASVTVDEAEVESGVGASTAPILVTVLPASAGGAADLSLQLVRDFPEHTVAVIAGNGFAASSDAVCPGVSAKLASDSADEYGEQLADGGDVTPMVVDFVNQIGQAPTSDCPATLAEGEADDDSSSIWLWLIAIGVAGLIASGVVVRQLRRRKARLLADRRAELDELAADLDERLRGVDPGGDPSAARALADATERRAAGTTALAGAETDDEYDAARRSLLEAMAAARFARVAVHADPGPRVLTPAEPFGPQLSEERDVRYADEVYRGHPDYVPGAQHYFGGDGTTPGGWYSVPFWESPSIGAVFARSDAGEGREER